MIEMNAVAAGTELDAARDAGREGVSAGWCAWSAGDASLTFSLVVRPDVNMHAFHGLPFVAAMGMMDVLAGTAATPGLGLAGKVGIQWPSDIVCGAPTFETSFARVAVNGGAGAAGMFGAVTVDIERAALSELGVDVTDEALVEALATAVLTRVDAWAVVANTPQGAAGPLAPCWVSTSIWCHCWDVRLRRCRPTACRLRRCVCGPGHLGSRDHQDRCRRARVSARGRTDSRAVTRGASAQRQRWQRSHPRPAPRMAFV